MASFKGSNKPVKTEKRYGAVLVGFWAAAPVGVGTHCLGVALHARHCHTSSLCSSSRQPRDSGMYLGKGHKIHHLKRCYHGLLPGCGG